MILVGLVLEKLMRFIQKRRRLAQLIGSAFSLKKIHPVRIYLTGCYIEKCDPDRIRTCDRLLRRQMLYPAELRDLFLFYSADKLFVSHKTM